MLFLRSGQGHKVCDPLGPMASVEMGICNFVLYILASEGFGLLLVLRVAKSSITLSCIHNVCEKCES